MSRKSNRFDVLDGLRGVAALCILIHHWAQCVGASAGFLGHAYLAVEFFFLLSGFVISNAYEHKLMQAMSFRRFVLIRVIRLYPLLGSSGCIPRDRLFDHARGDD
jgi:peptidoglycan/LPS O-acetylase OafA/YrhL